jgi:nucleotide-binding universal stress UspA family protein
MNAPDGPVLIAFDGSAAAREAVAAAARLLKPRRVMIVTVWDAGLAYATAGSPPDVGMTPSVDPATVLSVDRGLQQQAERVSGEGADLARSLGLDPEPMAVVDAGGVAQTILDLAREHRAAAIVVGSRGLSGLRARLEGSTSKAVSKRASAPVIVVHDAEAADD